MTLELYNIEHEKKEEVDSTKISDFEKKILDKIVRWKLTRDFDPKYGKRQGQIYGSIYWDENLYNKRSSSEFKNKEEEIISNIGSLKDVGILYCTWYWVPLKDAFLFGLDAKERKVFQEKNRNHIINIFKKSKKHIKLNYSFKLEDFKHETWSYTDNNENTHKKERIKGYKNAWVIKEKKGKKRRYLIVDYGDNIKVYFDSRYPYWHTSPYRLQFAKGYFKEDTNNISNEEWSRIESKIEDFSEDVEEDLDVGLIKKDSIIDVHEWKEFVKEWEYTTYLPDFYEDDFYQAFPNLRNIEFSLSSMKKSFWYDFWILCNIVEVLLEKDGINSINQRYIHDQNIKLRQNVIIRPSYQKYLPILSLDDDSEYEIHLWHDYLELWEKHMEKNTSVRSIAITKGEFDYNVDQEYDVEIKSPLDNKFVFEWESISEDFSKKPKLYRPDINVLMIEEWNKDNENDIKEMDIKGYKETLLFSLDKDIDKSKLPDFVSLFDGDLYNYKDVQNYLWKRFCKIYK